MNVHLQREITNLKKKILMLSAEVEEAMTKGVKSFMEGDVELAKQVVAYDDEIDRMEVEIEEDCLKILALHQPVAIDLRFVIAVLKIDNELERIADNVANLAKRTIYIKRSKNVEIPEQIMKTSRTAHVMLNQSLDALINMDTALARQVIATDVEIDELHRQMYERTEENIRKNPADVNCQISLLTVSRQLERISDLVTNIAEDVIYMVDGEIVRHGN